jgi:hypothetical protein
MVLAEIVDEVKLLSQGCPQFFEQFPFKLALIALERVLRGA